jgi:hypothetical protein
MDQHLIKQVQELKHQVSLLKEAGERSKLEQDLAAIQESLLLHAKNINGLYATLQQSGVQLPTDYQPIPEPGSETTYMPAEPALGTTVMPLAQPPMQYPQPNVPQQ